MSTSTQYSNVTLSTSSIPQLILTNPLPDGQYDIYVNQSGQNMGSMSIIISSGNFTCDYVSPNGTTYATIVQLPFPDSSGLYVTYNYVDSGNNGFYITSDNPQTDAEFYIYSAASSFSGIITSNNLYNSSGILNNNKLWAGSTTTTNGTFSIDISSAAFSSIISVQTTAANNTGDANSVPLASINTSSTSTITGNVVTGTTVVLDGESLTLAGSDITVYVFVIGT